MKGSWKDIAVIGMSVKVPGADTLDDFVRLLADGEDRVGDIPDRRRALSGIPAGKAVIPYGYLDDVDSFDHAFFRIARQEAVCMDPQQRIALQLVCEAIDNAGYRLSALRGSRTAVIMSVSDNRYEALLPRTGAAFLGTIPAAAAGKISYYLDLRGPAFMVDTGCSSSLVALHEACVKLQTGEADLALAGGVSVQIFFPGRDEPNISTLGIASPEGKSKTFDARADGSGGGEGGGFVLLKRLRDALRDRDHIYAVVRGSAVNHDGGRSASMAAPSSEAQTEVILAAWACSDIDPERIGYIEAHGTGTKLGDPIEVKGLADAFAARTDRKGFCALGALKTNIGHTGVSAGILSFIKAVLGVWRGKKFPLAHFRSPNPLIDFAATALYPADRLQDWSEPDRMAGVSSFGLTGTNAHVVIGSAPPVCASERRDGAPSAHVVKLSAKTERSLGRFAARLADYAERHPELELKDIARTMNEGRDDYAVRFAVVVKDLENLIAALREGAVRPAGEPPSGAPPVVLLCSGDTEVTEEQIRNLCGVHAAFRETWNRCLKLRPDLTKSREARLVAWQYGLLETWWSLGIRPARLLGTGTGNVTVRLATGELDLADALASAGQQAPDGFRKDAFLDAVRRMIEQEDPLFVELGADGRLSRELGGLAAARVCAAVDPGRPEPGLLPAFAWLYGKGAEVDWGAFYRRHPAGRKVPLPAYAFEPESCWPDVPVPGEGETEDRSPAPGSPDGAPPEAAAPDSGHPAPTEAGGTIREPDRERIERFLEDLFGELLGASAVDRDGDFFELGGNSLMGVQLVTRVKERFGIDMDFDLVYDYPSVRELAAWLEERLKERDADAGKERAAAIPRADRSGRLPLSHEQERMFVLYRQNPDTPHYNMPATIRLRGRLDADALEEAIRGVIRRHEILRTVYRVEDGEPCQHILEDPDFRLEREELWIGPSAEERDADARVLSRTREEAKIPFAIKDEIPIRAKLYYIRDGLYYLFVNIHHIAADGWSIGILVREIAELYTAAVRGRPAVLPEPAIQYADYAAWQRKWLAGEGAGQLAFWKRQLASLPDVLPLPADFPRPPRQSFRGASLTFAVDPAAYERLAAFSREQDVTLFVTLLAVYHVLLWRYANRTDICTGVPVANRHHTETERLIGFFANTVAIRTRPEAGKSFAAYLREVRDIVRVSLQHQGVPFEQVVQEVVPRRDPAYSPVFQHAFAWQNTGEAALELPEVDAAFLPTDSGGAKFDLTLSLREHQGGISGYVEYNADLFTQERIERFIRHYRNLLDAVCRAPEADLSALEMMDEDEKARLMSAYTVQDHHYDF